MNLFNFSAEFTSEESCRNHNIKNELYQLYLVLYFLNNNSTCATAAIANSIEASEFELAKGVRGKGAVGKSNVAILAESTPLEDIETGEQSTPKVLDGHDAESVDEVLKKGIGKESIVISDKSRLRQSSHLFAPIQI
jgi:hypothetical protein